MQVEQADDPKHHVKQIWWEDGDLHTIDSNGVHMVYQGAHLTGWKHSVSSDDKVINCEATLQLPMGKIVNP